VFQTVVPQKYQTLDSNGQPEAFFLRNFGELEFDWSTETVIVRIFGLDPSPAIEHSFALKDLDPKHISTGNDIECFGHQGIPSNAYVITSLVVFLLIVLGIPLAIIISAVVLTFMLVKFAVKSIFRLLRQQPLAYRRVGKAEKRC
jgi:hypothetical protein